MHNFDDMPHLPFSFLEFLEFRAWEFEKFYGKQPITTDDIVSTDFDLLCTKLQEKT